MRVDVGDGAVDDVTGLCERHGVMWVMVQATTVGDGSENAGLTAGPTVWADVSVEIPATSS